MSTNKCPKLPPSHPGPPDHFHFHIAINCQCLLHWTNRTGSQIKCWLQKLIVIIPPGFLGEKSRSPLTPPPPRAPPAGFSPPLLLPLSSGSCRAGVLGFVTNCMKNTHYCTWRRQLTGQYGECDSSVAHPILSQSRLPLILISPMPVLPNAAHWHHLWPTLHEFILLPVC